MDTSNAVVSRLVASVVAMTVILSFNYRIFIRASANKTIISRINSTTKDVMEGTERIGRIRYHYFNEYFADIDDNTDTGDGSVITIKGDSKRCSNILMIGVGTAMSVEDYDKIANSIVTTTIISNLVVVVSDSNPGNILKLSSTKYASLTNSIRHQLNNGLIPVCSRFNSDKKNVNSHLSFPETEQQRERQQRRQQQQQLGVNFLIGGHSASGQAALEAAQKGLYDFVPHGFVGLDPYNVSPKTMDFDSPLRFPTLSWGFTRTTCFVRVENAAQGAYRLSSLDSGRVLYLVDNELNDMSHCVFTDNGCGVGAFDVCPANENFEWMYESFAESIRLFVNALRPEGYPFKKKTFELPSTVSGNVSLFVNSDDDYNMDGNRYIGDSDNGGHGKITSVSLDASDISVEGGGDSNNYSRSVRTTFFTPDIPAYRGTIDSDTAVHVAYFDATTNGRSGSYSSPSMVGIKFAATIVGFIIFVY